MTTSWMRPEARPLQLKDLDYYQQEAIEKISGVLLEALGHVKSTARNGVSRGELDIDRTSRLFFLSGEAGGGKTTAYLSLRKALKKGAEAPPDEFPVLKKLHEDRTKLIWLEPLDLETAPEAHNFLAATLVRIEHALLGEEGGTPGKYRRPGVLEDSPNGTHQDFEKLRNDVVLAWEGNLRQRAEHIDPEVYSLEVIRSAEASLRINARFRKALEGVIKEDEKYRESLFILPVDDFYLTPSSSIELLRLLRMISIPRLFVLVLGNYFVIEELVYQNMLGKLVRQAGELALRHVERQAQTLTSTATELTAHSLRKLAPPAQRYELKVMHQLGALGFHPSKLDPSLPYDEKETLLGLLKQLPVMLEGAGNGRSTLYDFICLRDPDEEKKGDEYYTYSGLGILDLPPREVVDLWYSIEGVLRKGRVEKDEKKQWEATLEMIADTAVAAISGQSYISKQAQDLCSFAVKGHRGYEKLFDTTYLKAMPDLAPWLRLPLEDGVLLEASTHKGWLLYPSMVENSAAMAPRPTVWLTVLHDLMALSGEDRLIGEPLTPDLFGFGMVCRKQGDRQQAWPTPRWISFRHFDRLGFVWRKVVLEARKRRKAMTTGELVGWLAFYWIRYIVDILLENRCELQIEPGDLPENGWEVLGQSLRELASAPGRGAASIDGRLIEEWLLCLALEPALKERISDVLQPFWEAKAAEIEAIRKKPDESPAS